MQLSQFEIPPRDCRPLQFTPPFEQWCGTAEETIRANLKRLLDMGMGGLVLTVGLDNYLCSEPAWQVLRRGVQIARELGLTVWIYDEQGYPSGAAGGLVLDKLPDAEAQGLVRSRDARGNPTYNVVRLYEGTHATENFYKKRPYINILEPEAVATFIAVTHERYARALQPIAEYVEAFFTDEPSLIAAYIPRGKQFPQTLPWHPRLPDAFQALKGYDLLPHMESLFRNTGEIDRKVRCDFYEVIADLCAETYFGQLQHWCHHNGVLSSGHLLGEETLVWQTLFEGDPFACYRKFDIPGIDMILSNPEAIMREKYFLVPKTASSAARLQGKRRVMCEISDFLGALDGRHATLEQMTCTTGILSALGVTDFVCMYQPPIPRPPGEVEEGWSGVAPLSEQQYRAFADHTARLSALFSEATIETRVAVLHPLRTIWAHFTPSDRSMYEPHPDSDVQAVDESFTHLCRDLLRAQLDFDIVDELSMAESRMERGAMVVGGRRYQALVLPPMDTIRLQTMETIARCLEEGLTVVVHPLIPRYAAEGPPDDERICLLAGRIHAAGRTVGGPGGNATVVEALTSCTPPNCDLSPPSAHLLCTRLSRGREPTYFLVNTSSEEYAGICTFPSTGTTTFLDPATGKSRPAASERSGSAASRMTLSLGPFQTVFVVFQPVDQQAGVRTGSNARGDAPV